jgi:hypothetical protein
MRPLSRNSGKGAIFIGYRRDDSAEVVDRIEEALVAAFSRRRIFRDIQSIDSGVDFREHIEQALARCRIALIVIGPDWVSATDETGHRRLDDPTD